jgi:F-type H+-transporting ATPase subunit epsilon
MPMHVELVSPERVAYSGDAKMVIARTVSGDIAFLNGHVPFIGVLETWPVRVIQEDDTTQVIAVHSGFVEVSQRDEHGDSRVTILSDVAELAETIDIDRAKSARERALHKLADHPDDADAQAALNRAEVRLEVVGVPRAGNHSDH